MEAKDTIIHGDDRVFANIAKLLERQAEISFKAGMIEVTKYVEANYHPANVSHIHIVKNEWHTKLKEWGIE